MTISDKILDIIKSELKVRKERRIMPMLLTYYHLRQKAYELGVCDEELRNGLNQLYKESKINVGETINDRYIKLL